MAQPSLIESLLTLHIIPAVEKGPALQRIVKLDEIPTAGHIARMVGGPLHVIPEFTSILRDGAIEPCLALCNGLNQGNPYVPANSWANLLWLQAMVRAYGFSEAKTPNVVRGTVAILWGHSLSLEDLR